MHFASIGQKCLAIITLTKVTQDINMAGQAGDLVPPITPAMRESGVLELREKQFGTKLEEIVEDVYYAMEYARIYNSEKSDKSFSK
jgi:hypothetical protein